MAQKIVYEQENGVIAVVHPTGEVTIEELALKVVPSGTPYEIVDGSIIPTDRTFRGAWKATNVGIASTATEVYEDLALTKDIAHDLRRQKRSELFAPYDEIIMKQIPGNDAAAAEAARAVIRTEYAGIQSAIESATVVVGIKSTLAERGIITIVNTGMPDSGIGSTSVGVGSTSVGVGSTSVGVGSTSVGVGST